MKLHRFNSQRGDTIVEVLISIAIISSVMAGAFVAANRSLDQARQSQERSEASEILKAQTELLKVAIKDPTKRISDTTTPSRFCLDSTTNRNNLGNGSPPTLAADNFASYGPCKFGTDGRYNVAIERVTVAPAVYDYILTARWESFGLNGRDEVKYSYRAYE